MCNPVSIYIQKPFLRDNDRTIRVPKVSFRFINKLKCDMRNRSSRPEVSCRNGALRNFAKFTEKHLC